MDELQCVVEAGLDVVIGLCQYERTASDPSNPEGLASVSEAGTYGRSAQELGHTH